MLMSTAAATEAELEETRSQLRSCQSVNMRTATDLKECLEQLHQSQQALQQSENEGLALQVSLHRCQAELAATKQELAACMSKQCGAVDFAQRVMPNVSAVARAARKAVTESCMVGGNKQLVLNIGTVASLGRLRAASSRHPRGADYSATTLEEAAAFTLAQLWGYINFYKIPPKHRPAQKTLLHNLRRFVKQHIEQRTKTALSSGPGGVA
ncbi:hypothetical protein QJQ45_004601 [Haematococcus lacustris]|nr:hypothetical protein QJQ45_004601 [Haematococcus lacustris]